MELGWRNRGGTVFASGVLVSILRTLTLSLFFADVGGVGERVGESWLRVRPQHDGGSHAAWVCGLRERT